MGNTTEQWRASIESRARGCVLTISSKCMSTNTTLWFQLVVLLVLLVIGGIEINPGPNQNEVDKYEKTKGFADMTGENYELKMSALLFLRALQTGHQFHLASNMMAAGSFDDVVLTLGDCTVFLQLKHKKNPQTVLTLQDITRDKTFRLLKYLESYIDIKQRWQNNIDLQRCGKFENAKFVIYTNAGVDEDLVDTADSIGLLNIISTGGRCVCFKQLFENLPTYKAVLSAAVNSENVAATPQLWDIVQKLHDQQVETLPKRKELKEILGHLESLGDLSRYQQFNCQLYLCIRQASEADLRDYIRSEIHSDILLDKFLAGVQNWWRTSSYYLTAKSHFWQDILNKCAATVIQPNAGINVKFTKEHCDHLRQVFTSDNRMLYIQSQCINLSTLKVLQVFQSSLLVNAKKLLTHLSEMIAVWRLGMYDVLVVKGVITDTNILKELVSVPKPKRLVITDTVHSQLYKELQFVTFNDTFCLSQLDLASQLHVLEHEVEFQGLPVKLNSLADVSLLKDIVTCDVVIELHNSLQIGQRLQDIDPCYLPRKFLRRELVNEEIFRENSISIAVSGISEDRLAQLIPHGDQILKFDENNYAINNTCRYWIIQEEYEFTLLCNGKVNIHWIHMCEQSFYWRNSKGDMSPVLKHLESKSVSYYSVKEIIDLPQQTVLLTAEPGMGKSVEAYNIAHMIKQKDSSAWVIRVDLNQCTSLLTQRRITAMKFLQSVTTLNTEFERRLFEHQLQFRGNVVLILDGFDEISPNYSKQTFAIIKKLSEYKIKNIFITSRPVMNEELQNTLKTLAFSFQPFNPDDQKNFLVRYWSQKHLNLTEILQFINSLLQLIELSLKDKWRKFAGIPLQCRMLADIFQEEVSHYCQTGEMRLPQSLNVLQLYDKFIDKKWKFYYKKLNVDGNTAMIQILLQNQKLQLEQSHMICAMVSYFDYEFISNLNSSEDIVKGNQLFIDQFKSGQDKSGIISHITVDGKALFVHRTFAEYFIALWFSQNYENELTGIKNIYFNLNFEIIQKFLDRMLAQEFDLHTAVINQNLPEIEYLLSEQETGVNDEDEGGRTALHLAIINYFYDKIEINDFITNMLLKHGADINCEDRVLHYKHLRLAEELKVWSLVEKLLESQADNRDLVWIKTNIGKQHLLQIENDDIINMEYHMSDALHDVMHTALTEGYINLIDFILKSGVSVQHCINAYGISTTMLHIAAEFGHLRLVQFIIEHGVDCSTCVDEYKRTPLMLAAECDHIQVAEFLINHAAPVTAKDVYGNSALSLAVLEENHEMVKLLLANMSYNIDEKDVVIYAVGYGDMKAVKFLIENNIINSQNQHGNTALILAACLGKIDIVELLLQNGADVQITGQHKRTVLMHAAERGHLQLVKLLIKHGASVNATDEDGYSALSLARRRYNHFAELLLDLGAHE